VLHAVASVVSQQDKQGEVNPEIPSLIQHEPDEGTPDIRLQPDGCEPFWIEATYIMPKEQDVDLENFKPWVKEELFKIGIAGAKSLEIQLKPADTTKDVEVPPSNLWDQLLNTDRWKTFVAELSSGNLESTLSLKEANVIVRIEGIMQGDFVSSSFQAPGVPKCVEDNLIYRTIKKKAVQAQKWADAGKTFQPLVLCIGASEGLQRLNASDIFSKQLKQAVYSALADVEQLNWATIMNLTGNLSWPGSMRSQQVSGSELISAVAIVNIRNHQDSEYGLVRRASRPLIIKNPHPNVALTTKQEQFLSQINFNLVKYKPGRESWESPHPKADTEALNRHRRDSQKRCGFSLERRQSGDFTVKIPGRILARLLAGDITADEVWDYNRLDLRNYPNPTLSLEQNIGWCLKKVVEDRKQQIANVNFVEVDSKSRDESGIRLEFGENTAPIEPIDENCLRSSIELDVNGAFTLKLSISLMTCLLAGKITADEVWKSKNQQKIGDCLKQAVSRGQEIVDAKFVQLDSEFENEPQIVLKFGVATDTVIREDKKRLRELKQPDKRG
jgi:hypothetical protein